MANAAILAQDRLSHKFLPYFVGFCVPLSLIPLGPLPVARWYHLVPDEFAPVTVCTHLAVGFSVYAPGRSDPKWRVAAAVKIRPRVAWRQKMRYRPSL